MILNVLINIYKSYNLCFKFKKYGLINVFKKKSFIIT